jgi:multicomponent Na+:H+ antiporter subunit D
MPGQAARARLLGSWLAWLLPIALLATLSVLIGLASEPVLNLATRAAEQLLNPAGYIETVLGGLP